MEEFCHHCESIIYQLEDSHCPLCKSKRKAIDQQSATVTRTVIWFDKKKVPADETKVDSNSSTGPTVDKYCNKCGVYTMHTYFTAQLRSADEGQTVFYTCPKCMIQTFENS